MKAQLTFSFDTLQELYEFTAKHAAPVPVNPQTQFDFGFHPGPTAEMKTVAVVEPPAAEPTKVRKARAAKTEEAPAPAAPAAEQPADVEAVRAAITAVNDKFGLVAARRVLKQFSANRIPDLKPEQYAEFVKACQGVK